MSLVDNLFERSTVRFADRLQRAVSEIADTEQISHLITLGNAENGSRFVLISRARLLAIICGSASGNLQLSLRGGHIVISLTRCDLRASRSGRARLFLMGRLPTTCIMALLAPQWRHAQCSDQRRS